jgi:hypothetical protein
VPHEIEEEKKHRSFIRYGVRIGLTGRLFLLVIAVVSPGLIIQAWNEYDLRLAHEADVRQQVVQTTKQLGEEIGEIRAGAHQMLLALTQLEIIKFRQPEACRALLTKLRFQYPSYSVLGAADSDGRVFCTNLPTSYSSVANLPFFTRAMAQDGLAVGNYWVDQASGQKMIHFAERFDDSDGQIAGVVFAGLNLGWLSDHLKGLGLSPSASVMITDREGNIIARLPNPERLVGKNIRKSHERIMDGDEAGWEEATGADGVTRIFGYVPAALPPKDFFLSTGQSKAQVFAAIDSATWRGVGLILASLFAAVYIAWAGARKFIQGLLRGPKDGAMTITTVASSELAHWESAVSEQLASTWPTPSRAITRRIRRTEDEALSEVTTNERVSRLKAIGAPYLVPLERTADEGPRPLAGSPGL